MERTSNFERSTSITKFEIDDKLYYVKVLWKPSKYDLFHIKLYDGYKTWSGRFSYEFANKYKQRFEETDAEYYITAKTALSQKNGFNFSFSLQPDDNKSATFSWKKVFLDQSNKSVSLVHGCVPIHTDSVNESKDFLIDVLIAENRTLRDKIDYISNKNATLANELDKCKNELNKFVDTKTNLETSLYGKFVQLLSAKKRRMELMEGGGEDNKLSETSDSYTEDLD